MAINYSQWLPGQGQQGTNVTEIINATPEGAYVRLGGTTGLDQISQNLFKKQGRSLIPVQGNATGEVIDVPITAQQWNMAGNILPASYSISPTQTQEQSNALYQADLNNTSTPRINAQGQTISGTQALAEQSAQRNAYNQTTQQNQQIANMGPSFAGQIPPITGTPIQQGTPTAQPTAQPITQASLPGTYAARRTLAQSLGILNYTETPQQVQQLQQALNQRQTQGGLQGGTPPAGTPTPSVTPPITQQGAQGGVSGGTPIQGTGGQTFALTGGNLAVGARGTTVQNLQGILNTLMGTTLDTDGIYGPKTQKAVKDFQKAAGITVDGIVGPETTAAINSALAQKGGGEPVVPPPAPTGSGNPIIDSATESAGLTSENIQNQPASKTFEDMLSDAFEKAGITELQNKLLELQKEKAAKASAISNNPWIPEERRMQKLSSLDKEYDTNISNLQSQIDKTTGYAIDIANMTLSAYNKQQELDETRKQNAIQNALKKAEIASKGTDYVSGIIGEYQFAKENGYTGSFTQYQNEDANRKLAVAKAGATTISTGVPTTQDVSLKTTQDSLETVNTIGNLLSDPNFNKAMGIWGSAVSLNPESDEAYILAKIKQVKDSISLSAREKLKGQGQISNYEGKMLADAQSALRIGMKASNARQELINISGILTTASGGKTKVLITDKKGGTSVNYANGQTIAQMRADGLSVNYIQ